MIKEVISLIKPLKYVEEFMIVNLVSKGTTSTSQPPTIQKEMDRLNGLIKPWEIFA